MVLFSNRIRLLRGFARGNFIDGRVFNAGIGFVHRSRVTGEDSEQERRGCDDLFESVRGQLKRICVVMRFLTLSVLRQEPRAVRAKLNMHRLRPI